MDAPYIKRESDGNPNHQRSTTITATNSQPRHIYNSGQVPPSITASSHIQEQLQSPSLASLSHIQSANNRINNFNNNTAPPPSSAPNSLTMLAALANNTPGSSHNHANPHASGEHLPSSRSFPGSNQNLIAVAQAIAAAGGGAGATAIFTASAPSASSTAAVYPNHSPPPYPSSTTGSAVNDHQVNGSVSYSSITSTNTPNQTSGGSASNNSNGGNGSTGSNGPSQYITNSPQSRASPYVYVAPTGTARHHHHHQVNGRLVLFRRWKSRLKGNSSIHTIWSMLSYVTLLYF